MTVATTRPDSISTTTSTLIPSSTGFDKIDLRLTDWTVRQDHMLTIHHRSSHKIPTLLFRTSTGPVFGYGAHYKSNWWYLNIIVPRPGIRHCLLGFNASRFENLINYPAADPALVRRAVAELGRQLPQIGIESDLSSAVVRRLEVCSDIPVDNCLESYWEALEDCPPPSRMKTRRRNNGISWFNGRSAIKAYGKYFELRHRYGAATDNLNMPDSNTVRFESAVLTPAAVRNKLEVDNLNRIDELHGAALTWHLKTWEGILEG